MWNKGIDENILKDIEWFQVKLSWVQAGCELLSLCVPEVKNERRETWRRYEGDSYLFWHSDNADCDSAKEFCAERKANLTLIDQNNLVLYWVSHLSYVP